MHKIDKIIHGMLTANLPSNYWIVPCVELPELETSKLVMQHNGQSVWEHTMSVIDLLMVKNPITLLSGLFHDLGKRGVPIVDNISLPRFPNHANESACIAKIRLLEWKTTPYIIDRVVRLVSTHMFDISNAMKEKTIRKFVADVGRDNIDNWFVMRISDSRSYSAQQKYQNYFIEPFRKAVMLYLEQQPSIGQPIFEQPNKTGGIQIKGGDSK